MATRASPVPRPGASSRMTRRRPTPHTEGATRHHHRRPRPLPAATAQTSSQGRIQTPSAARERVGRSRPYLLEVRQRPGPIEEGLCRLVEAEVREPVLPGDGRDPVLLEASRRLRPAIDIHRAVLVFLQIHARQAIGNFLIVQDQCASVGVIDRDGPGQLDRWMGPNAQPIGRTGVQPLCRPCPYTRRGTPRKDRDAWAPSPPPRRPPHRTRTAILRRYATSCTIPEKRRSRPTVTAPHLEPWSRAHQIGAGERLDLLPHPREPAGVDDRFAHVGQCPLLLGLG